MASDDTKSRQSFGFDSFLLHTLNPDQEKVMGALDKERAEAAPKGFLRRSVARETPETMARKYLEEVMRSPSVPEFNAPNPEAGSNDFKFIDSESVPAIGSTFVRFRQQVARVPVYGSLITVEMNSKNQLISLSTSVAEPEKVGSVASVAPAQALAVVKARAKAEQPGELVPKLYFYFNPDSSTWHLAYIFEDVTVAAAMEGELPASAPSGHFDIIVDAHSGQIIEELPRLFTQRSSAPSYYAPGVDQGMDEYAKKRSFPVSIRGLTFTMDSKAVKVRTHDFGYQDVAATALPGTVANYKVRGKAPPLAGQRPRQRRRRGHLPTEGCQPQ